MWNQSIAKSKNLSALAAIVFALALAGCAGGDNGGATSGAASSSGAGASTGAGSSSSSSSSGTSSGSSGSGGAGGGGDTFVTCNSIVDELRADLDGGLLAHAAAEGWPAKASDGYLFVSTNMTLGLLAGDHDGWAGSPMAKETSFLWACVDVQPGDHYKFTDKTTYAADPWSRSYTYDNFGEISLVAPSTSHLDRFFNIGDAKLEPRDVRVWVPEGGYSRVLYVHDGQNLFDPEAIWGGWHLQDSAPTGILIVGIDNTPARLEEYTHVKDDIDGTIHGGLGDEYADFLKNTVRPLIQAKYGEKGPIGVMGSSLGGLISFHIAYHNPGDYAFAASLSGTMGWGSIGPTTHNETMIERYKAKGHQSTVLYLDSGGSGPCADSDNDGIDDDDPNAGDNYCENIQMRDTLVGVGYKEGADLFHWYEPGAEHNEAAWAKRVFHPLDVFKGL